MASTSEELNSQAEQLQHTISFFKVDAYEQSVTRALPATTKKKIAVITSYSIHYTKLYEQPRHVAAWYLWMNGEAWKMRVGKET